MVCAIVLTHNRKGLLRECLAAVRVQTTAPGRVLVVDNASTDGTPDLLRHEFPDIEVLSLAENEGSAGGFHEGIKRAHSQGADWMWLMDDDTVPAPEALAELLRARSGLDGQAAPTLLASKVVWRDGRVHPMNFASPARRHPERMVEAAERGLMPIGSATWVSLLLHRGAVDRHGLPLKQFFIWSDDIEYTGRILSSEPGYLVPRSIALHNTEAPHTAMTSAPDRFYFHVRNLLFIIRRPTRSRRDRLVFLWLLLQSSGAYLISHPGLEEVRWIARGARDGLRARQSA
jgi:rhamnopyranosyl-N-acetylglucosaminyl-diphospho-decaprenol beta-1,3/1,4-galactofuranosyltransferase